MTTIAKKEELIKWISSLENKNTLEQIFQFRNLKSQDFDQAIEQGITVNVLKEETDAYLKSLDWKSNRLL